MFEPEVPPHDRPVIRSGAIASRRVLRWLAVVLFLLSQGPQLSADPTWTHLYPSGAQRGSRLRVQIVGGKFESWPVEVWTDTPGLAARAAAEKGTLEVELSPDCAPGQHWLRLHDALGASAPRPFLVGTVPEVLEKESNDTPATAQALAEAACVVNGRLQKNGDTDSFAIEVPAGRTLVASMIAHERIGSPMDAVLQIVSSEGFVLAQNHDTNGLDPELAWKVPAAGRYIVRTFAFPATPDASIRFTGKESYIYRLTVTTQGFADYTMPLSLQRAVEQPIDLVGWNLEGTERAISSRADDDREALELFAPGLANTPVLRVDPQPSLTEAGLGAGEEAPRISIPCSVSGVLSRPGERDHFAFEGEKGDRLVFRLEARDFGSPVDPVLSLLGPDARSIARADDIRGSRASEVATTLPASGTYGLLVSDLYGHGGPRHIYRLTCLRQEPSFSLSVDSDRFEVAAGAKLEIAVKVERRYGLSGPIEISAADLPPGLSCEPGISENGGKKATPVKLGLRAGAAPFSGPFRILGTVKGRTESSRRARFGLPGLNVPPGLDTAVSHRFWLTVTRTKADS